MKKEEKAIKKEKETQEETKEEEEEGTGVEGKGVRDDVTQTYQNSAPDNPKITKIIRLQEVLIKPSGEDGQKYGN